MWVKRTASNSMTRQTRCQDRLTVVAPPCKKAKAPAEWADIQPIMSTHFREPHRLLLLIAVLLLPAVSLRAEEKPEPPVPVRTVPPEVPSSFLRGGEAGLVTLTFLVDDKGNVQTPSVVKSTHRELEEPAIKAVKKWRFKPGRKDGNAVAVHVTIPLKFEVE